MNSDELKKLVAEKVGLSQEKVSKTIAAFQDTVNKELNAGNNINIPGFGTFVMIKYPSKTVRDARNPSKTYLSLEKNMPRFRPSPDFKRAISGRESNAPDEPIEFNATNSLANISYIDCSKIVVPKRILNLIPEHIARHYQIVPIDEKEGKLTVAMIDPEDREAIEFVKKKTGKDLEIRITTKTDINHVLDQYSALSGELKKIIESAENEEELKPKKKESLPKEEEMIEAAPAAKIVQSIFKRAAREKASDIHIEPYEDEIVVRFRVDGILTKVISLPKEIHPAVVSRVKILANLKIDETRLPQDGRFQTIIDGAEIDFRISTLPTVNGEKIVARVLDKTHNIISLEQLGIKEYAYKTLDENIHKAHGMILVTGPTGSGKTTTLYAMIDRMKSVGINIVTLEDPVEYRMPTINQSQVNAHIGYTFATGLRSIVRQDPDVVMVGEIRDFETADMAIHAALTGHVVLSTLHTNTAAGAVPRLLDMKIEPFLINSSLNCVIAQRLCRKICDTCKEPLEVDQSEKELVIDELKSIKGLDEKLSNISFFHGKGCDNCGGTGYKGRIGIYEIFELNEEIKALIAKRSPEDALAEQAMKDGMVTLKQDGFIKAIEGITTLEEVWRTTKD